MKVSLTDAGKRFNRDWIFRHLSFNFEQGNSYAIIGPNGSGKSTLLQVLSGSMQVNEGNVSWSDNAINGSGGKAAVKSRNNDIAETVYNHISICAPYLEVIEEMTLKEFLLFHQQFKPWLPGVSIDDIVGFTGLDKAVNKQIRFYSSGMKQRVKLAQAIFSNTPILLLDEPCTNLDNAGVTLYHRLIGDYCREKLVVVSSNDEVEYSFCTGRVDITDYKK